MKRDLTELKKKIFSELSPWETVEVSRHPERPMTTDYLALVFDEFVELHGDKSFGDDRAIRTGFAKLDQYKVMVIGHQKGKTLKERNACHFGCAHPEGYRKAMSARCSSPRSMACRLICFIDTPGAYPGVGAEERGQSQVIAESMFQMSRLPMPIICVVIGEGGSGGALGIGVGDKVADDGVCLLLGHQPEGLRRNPLEESHPQGTGRQGTAADFAGSARFGVIDDVIEEPLGGAHRDHPQMAARLKMYLIRCLRELTADRPINWWQPGTTSSARWGNSWSRKLSRRRANR